MLINIAQMRFDGQDMNNTIPYQFITKYKDATREHTGATRHYPIVLSSDLSSLHCICIQ